MDLYRYFGKMELSREDSKGKDIMTISLARTHVHWDKGLAGELRRAKIFRKRTERMRRLIFRIFKR